MKKIAGYGILLFAGVLGFCFLLGQLGLKWPGIDEAVVEKFARAANRPPAEPLINTNQGDLLLFVFLIAGAIGGFIGGYFYRELFPPKPKAVSRES